MNAVFLIGNLVRDPELKYSTGSNQTAICRFTIAVNDGFGENQKTDFIRIVTFGKLAENCDRCLKKGKKVGVEGKVKTGSYDNKDGKKVYTTDIVASKVEFLSGAQAHGDAPGAESQAQAAEAGASDYPDYPDDGFFASTDDDDDIPF